MATKKIVEPVTDLEQKKPTRKPRVTKKSVDVHELPTKKETNDILSEAKGNLRNVVANMIAVASMNQRKDVMSAVAESIVKSFDNYKNAMGRHIATRDVEFTCEFSDSNESLDTVMFSETVTGPQAGNALNVNIDYFRDLYNQKRDIDLVPKKYSKHEYVEYKYNVANIVEYYTKRFPDILDLFDVFSDMCLNKSDIGVTVEFSDEFIQKFFIDEFQRVLEERQEIEDMIAQQSMGITGLEEETGEYLDFGELDNQLDGGISDTTDEDLSPIISLFKNFEQKVESQVPNAPPLENAPVGKNISDPMEVAGISPPPTENITESETSSENEYESKTITNPMETSGIEPPPNSIQNKPSGSRTIGDLRQFSGLSEEEELVKKPTPQQSTPSSGKTIKDLSLFDSNGKRVSLKNLVKTHGSTIFDSPEEFIDDESEDSTIELSPYDKQMMLYDEIYKSVIYQYNILISKIEKKIKKVIDNKLIKKIKYATRTADVYGYSIVAISKSNPDDINIYNPLEVRLYKKKKSNLDTDNFIFGKIESDGTNQKLKVLNHQYHCYILSLDPMVMMPIPNIVRISWYLYLMDLVEILIIYNDLLKSKTIHLLEIPVFDGNSGYDDGQGAGTQNVTDSLALMNMIINNIESKLVMDTEYIQQNEGTEDVAMKLLKNVGLSVAYVPKLTPESRIENIRLDTDDNEYDKLYTMLNEKIFAVLKFPIWFRSSIQIMNTLKAVPREAVQFAHLTFMSRVNSALSELESFLEFIVQLHADEFTVSYQSSEEQVPVKLENIKIRLRSILGEYLFENYKQEQSRSTKLQNLLTFVSAGFTVNPKWAVEYVFPEYTIADVLVDAGTELETKRQEIENALNGVTAPSPTENLEGSDLAAEEGVVSEEQPIEESGVHKINWDQVRTSFANSLISLTRGKTDTLELKNIAKSVDNLIRYKSHSFNIKRV